MNFYSTSPIKRKRRSRDEVYGLYGAVVDILDEYRGEPITIRHLFYRLVSRGVIEKDEKAYRNLCAHLSKWRKAGHLQFDYFVDGTRWYHGEIGFSDAAEALDDAIAGYRKDLWKSQKYIYRGLVRERRDSISDHAAGEGVGSEGISVSRVCFVIIDVCRS